MNVLRLTNANDNGRVTAGAVILSCGIKTTNEIAGRPLPSLVSGFFVLYAGVAANILNNQRGFGNPFAVLNTPAPAPLFHFQKNPIKN